MYSRGCFWCTQAGVSGVLTRVFLVYSGGCFWCTQAVVSGVLTRVSGVLTRVFVVYSRGFLVLELVDVLLAGVGDDELNVDAVVSRQTRQTRRAAHRLPSRKQSALQTHAHSSLASAPQTARPASTRT